MRRIEDWFGLTSVAEGREVVVLGLPWDGSASGRGGSAEAPAAIRGWARSSQAITESGRSIRGVRVIDAGDVVGGHAEMERAARKALAARPEAFLLGIGGDHSVTQPLLRAVADRHPGLGLLWLDAHADLFPAYEGDRQSHACTVARAWESGVEPTATTLVGLRSYASEELEGLERAGAVVPAARWLCDGTAAVADRIVDRLAGRPVYLSLDIDVLDPAAAPATGYPIAGGPSSRELLDLLYAVWPRLDVVAMDLVEVAPPLDPAQTTAACAAHLLLQSIGLVGASVASEPRAGGGPTLQ